MTPEQQIVGYIIYESYLLTSEWDNETHRRVTSPTLSWKKKIYETITAAQEALTHIEQHSWRHGTIIPIYANVSDIQQASAKYQQLKQKIK